MNFIVNRVIRSESRLIVFNILAIFLMTIIAAGTVLLHVRYNPKVGHSRSATARPVEGIHNISQRVEMRHITNSTPTSNPVIVRQTIWVVQETTLFKLPCIGPEIAHVGSHFPLTLQGSPGWMAGTLWYPVQWSTPNSTNRGWVSAATVTFTPPGNMVAWASLDVLTPDLMASLAPLSSSVGVAIYDVTHQRYYTYQSNSQFLAASSIKVSILLAFLDMIERQKREPTNNEMTMLTTMIENSDNDAASALYFNELGGAAGIASILKRWGIVGLTPSSDAWGYSLITPQTMVDMLTLLQQGKILTPSHRALALSLMEHVEIDQRAGVGDTAPGESIVAMKNGWVPGPDARWVINTSGIVMGRKETYIVAVYVQEQPSLTSGQAITQRVCRAIAQTLLPQSQKRKRR